MTTPSENYLYDALPELLRRAREARAAARQKKGEHGGFEEGRAMAYYEVVSYLIGQLDAFGIKRSAVRIDSTLNVDRDLL